MAWPVSATHLAAARGTPATWPPLRGTACKYTRLGGDDGGFGDQARTSVPQSLETKLQERRMLWTPFPRENKKGDSISTDC